MPEVKGKGFFGVSGRCLLRRGGEESKRILNTMIQHLHKTFDILMIIIIIITTFTFKTPPLWSL